MVGFYGISLSFSNTKEIKGNQRGKTFWRSQLENSNTMTLYLHEACAILYLIDCKNIYKYRKINLVFI